MTNKEANNHNTSIVEGFIPGINTGISYNGSSSYSIFEDHVKHI